MLKIFEGPAGFGHGAGLPAVHGGGDDGAGGGLVGLLDGLLETLSRGLEPGSGASWDPIAGIEALGANVHPLIVHFPIAFLSAFLLLEILGLVLRRPALRTVASGLLYLGAVGAVAAAAAGLVAEDIVPHGGAVHEIMEWHERLGLTVAALSVILAVWRAVSGGRFASSMALGLHLTMAVILNLCLVLGADLGGLMVYQYGVGVKSLQDEREIHQHAHDGADVHQAAEPAPESPPMPAPATGAAAPAAAGESKPAPSPPKPDGHRHTHTHPHAHSHGAAPRKP
jgi:uncharacterized membrane protein